MNGAFVVWACSACELKDGPVVNYSLLIYKSRVQCLPLPIQILDAPANMCPETDVHDASLMDCRVKVSKAIGMN